MKDISKQILEKIKTLIPVNHLSVTIHVREIIIVNKLFYEVRFFSVVDEIKFMPQWMNIKVDTMDMNDKVHYYFLSLEQIERLLGHHIDSTFRVTENTLH